MTDVGELLPVVARREGLLAVLYESPQAKCDLVRSLDVSRSTIDRAVRRLESEGLVERRASGYGLTLVGRLVYEEYRTFTERTTGLLDASPVLEALPADTPLDPAAFFGANVTAAERATPYRPGDRHLELMEEAEGARLLSTAVGPRYVEAVRATVVERDTPVKLGVTTAVGERLVTEYADALGDALSSGELELRELDDTPPFSLGLFDRPSGTVFGALIYDGDAPRAYVDNDTEPAVEYGEARFERYWADAEPIAPVVEPPSE
jgi:predicted transcriptional regulator